MGPNPSPNPNPNPNPSPNPNPDPNPNQVDRTMGQWDIVLGRKQAKKDWRRQQTQQAATVAVTVT